VSPILQTWTFWLDSLNSAEETRCAEKSGDLAIRARTRLEMGYLCRVHGAMCEPFSLDRSIIAAAAICSG
jgi:hypothetical protein